MAGTTEKDKALIKQYLTESGSFDNTGTPVMVDNYFDAIVDLKEICDSLGGDIGDIHDEVTLSSDDTTQETLSLTDQELTVSLATTSTDGAMSAADKAKLDGIEAGAEVNPTFKTINGTSIIGVGDITITEGEVQVQSDWDEVDNGEPSYILNKPDIPAELSDLGGDLDDIADGATYVKSENNFTDAYKTKLDSIATGAEVNVQSDWNAVSGDALILNKPTIPAPSSLYSSGGLVSDINVAAGGGNKTIFNFTVPNNTLCLVQVNIKLEGLNTSDEILVWWTTQSDTSDVYKAPIDRVLNTTKTDYYISKVIVFNNFNVINGNYRVRIEPPAGGSFDVKTDSHISVTRLA